MFSLDGASYVPFMTFCPNRALREQMYRAYVTRASSGKTDNSAVMARTLQLRSEMAGLLGFKHYAEYSLANKVAPDVESVQAFQETVLSHALPAARRELEELTAYAQASGKHTGPLLQWDIPFWSERLKQDRYGYEAEEVRRYFTVPKVVQGLKKLCEDVFGVTLHKLKTFRRPTASAARDQLALPVWHSSVQAYVVGEIDEDDEKLADRSAAMARASRRKVERQLLQDGDRDDSDLPDDDEDVIQARQSNAARRRQRQQADSAIAEDTDSSSSVLPRGILYFDPFSRPKEKNQGAWVDDCLPRRLLPPDESGHRTLQLPAAYIVCNIAPPAVDSASGDTGRAQLMTFRDVETLFHEFGHAAHHVLTNVNYSFVAGQFAPIGYPSLGT